MRRLGGKFQWNIMLLEGRPTGKLPNLCQQIHDPVSPLRNHGSSIRSISLKAICFYQSHSRSTENATSIFSSIDVEQDGPTF